MSDALNRRARLLVLLACLAQPAIVATAAAPIVVNQVNRAFSVRELRIRRGDVVRFANSDEFLHHLYLQSPTFNFNSGEQEPGRNVDVRFSTAGRFEVLCEIHPRMRLNVIVE